MAPMRPPSMRRFVIPVLLASAILAGCRLLPGQGGSAGASPSDAGVAVRGHVVAGPVCPVVTDPPQSNCEARPVSGAVILVLAADGGASVTRLTSDESGDIRGTLPPGRYRLVPQAVEGLMGTAPEQSLTVKAGEPVEELVISYDTGIR